MPKNSPQAFTNIPKSAGYLILPPLIVWMIVYSNDWNTSWFIGLNQFFSKLPEIFWTGTSLLGNGWAIFALALPIIFLIPRAMYSALIAGILTAVLSHTSKAFFDTPRPAALLDHNLFQIIEKPLFDSSMPSGHTMTAFAICTAIIFSLPTNYRGRFLILWILAIGVACSRIAVGAHWPSDVLVGASLGILCGLVGANLSWKISGKWLETFSTPILIIILLASTDVYVLSVDQLDFALNLPIQKVLSAIVVMTQLSYLGLYFKNLKRKSKDV